MPENLRLILLETIEASLQAQLNAVRRLRQELGHSKGKPPSQSKTGRSQVSVVYDILLEAGSPLHVSEIIELAQKRFRQKFDRESLVSALTKRIVRGDRFVRTAPNTFGLLPQAPKREEA